MNRRARWWSLDPPLRGAVVGLAVALPIVALGFLLHGMLVLAPAVPVLDTAAIVCLLIAAAVAALDAWLRADRRAIPALAISAALAVLWAAHLILFPGTVPGMDHTYASVATSSVFVAINLMTPLMLSVALLWLGGTLATPGRTAAVALAIGLLLGGLMVATALSLTPTFPTVTAAGVFTNTERWVGAAGLVPALVGLTVFLTGRRGDVRVSNGLAAALVIAGTNSIVLFFSTTAIRSCGTRTTCLRLPPPSPCSRARWLC